MGKRDEIQNDTELDPTQNGEPAEEIARGDGPSDLGDEAPLLDEMIAQLSAAEKQAQENYERLLRVSAEFENYKKRSAREMQDVIKYANENIAKELLVVVDNLERAIDSATVNCPSDDPLVQGLEMTLNDTLKLLERQHVKAVKALGQPFDPSYHQAMMQEEVEDQPSNMVVRELQKGYMIHDRLLRPALVAVSKAGSANYEDNASSETDN